MYLWPALFVASLMQALFLIFILCVRRGKNTRAKYLLVALLILMVLANFDDLLIATGLYRPAPWLFGLSMNAMLAYGPLLWLYAVSVTVPSFQWSKRTWLHFLPFFASTLLQIPFFLLPATYKIRYLETFLSGKMPFDAFGIGMFAGQLAHLMGYLWLTAYLIRNETDPSAADRFLAPASKRAHWLKGMLLLFGIFFLIAFALFCWNLSYGYFIPKANFVYTLASSAILYFMAYHLMLTPELITPDFTKKYHTIRMTRAQEDGYLKHLDFLMESEKIFVQPDLKLAALATRLNISPHALSKLINDKFNMPFPDFLNRYRVEEFIRRQQNPKYSHHSFLGLAYDVGFQSKSAFNAAFKKITGKTPSDFKDPV